ncbi:MAG TPA: hypothetical protein VFE62_19815 [Gemmataceae bacterium]|nr:hypothetical protein [Pirellulales bacterium]HZZ80759.1 hypothetical protein [Gemmataceae bacterium]
MPDDSTHQDRLKRGGAAPGLTGILQSKDADGDHEEASCGAFGYLRGLRDQSAAIEFRFRDGNSMWFPYRSMGPWQYNPSEGLLLQFNSDVVHLVLIKGSNLAKPLNEGAINLTHAGLQRHRVLWVREMSDDEMTKVGETGPTIDTIEVVEFDSRTALTEWISKKAPAFLRSPLIRREGPGR